MRKFLALMFLSSTFAFALAGCNTIEGAGEDIEEAGEEIEDAAN